MHVPPHLDELCSILPLCCFNQLLVGLPVLLLRQDLPPARLLCRLPRLVRCLGGCVIGQVLLLWPLQVLAV